MAADCQELDKETHARSLLWSNGYRRAFHLTGRHVPYERPAYTFQSGSAA